MVSALISRLVILFLGTLYPVYGSYKAIQSRKPREYTNWMMYWICFGLFSFFETFSDIFLAFCVPFYYELKIVFLVWLLSPLTNGAALLYKNFVHPRLVRHERDIDNMIARTKENGVTAVYQLGTRGAHYFSQLLATTAVKGQQVLLEQLQRSYSPNQLTQHALLNEPSSANENEQTEVRKRTVTRRRIDARRQVVSAPTFSDDSEDPDDPMCLIEEYDDDLLPEEFTQLPSAPSPQPKASTKKKEGLSDVRSLISSTDSESEQDTWDESEIVRMHAGDMSVFDDSDSDAGTTKKIGEPDPEWYPSTRSRVARKKPVEKRAESNNNLKAAVRK